RPFAGRGQPRVQLPAPRTGRGLRLEFGGRRLRDRRRGQPELPPAERSLALPQSLLSRHEPKRRLGLKAVGLFELRRALLELVRACIQLEGVCESRLRSLVLPLLRLFDRLETALQLGFELPE